MPLLWEWSVISKKQETINGGNFSEDGETFTQYISFFPSPTDNTEYVSPATQKLYAKELTT